MATTKIEITDDINQATLAVAKPAKSYLTYDVETPDHEYNPILARLEQTLSIPSDLTKNVTAKIFFNDGSDSGVTASFTLNGASQWTQWPSTILFTPGDAAANWLGILYVDDTFFDPNGAVTWSDKIPDKDKCYADVGIGKTGSWPPTGGLSSAEADALAFILKSPTVQALFDIGTNRQTYGAGLQKLQGRIS